MNDEKDVARPRPTGVRQDEQVPRHAAGPSAATAPEKTTHTPGPWRVVSEADAKASGYNIHQGEIVAGDVHVVCMGHDYDDGGAICARWCEESPSRAHKYDAECEANARLIAAAPDLLDAAKEWSDLHARGMTSVQAAKDLYRSGAVPCAWEKLKAAIAKAEGQQ